MAGLYIHIPFCRQKCLYCDFVSYPCPERAGDFVLALLSEINLAAKTYPNLPVFDTVFFGGGTPSLLTGAQLCRILTALRENFQITSNAEISLEANPGTVTGGFLTACRAAGVNRLSFGVQSLNDGLLAGIGRIHRGQDVLDCLALARKAGFENINADVMHGLPGQRQEDYLDTLKIICDLGLPHISSYALILEEGTPLFDLVSTGKVSLPSEDAVADMEDTGIAYLKERGYHRYEISNFALPGYPCRHNLNYWANGEYLSFGPAAHSCLRLDGAWTRWSNRCDLDGYLDDIASGRLPLEEQRVIPRIEEMFETLMVGLRTASGVDRAAFVARFGQRIEEAYPLALGELEKRGWLSPSPSHLALNERGLDMNNAAIGLFLKAE